VVTALRPFRFGVQVPSARSLEDWTEKVKAAEAMGFDVLTIPDHFGDHFAPFAALGAAAAVTSRLRLGTMVIDNDFRHPAVTAKELATLDVLSGGRLEVGLGAGWRESDYAPTGIRFEEAGVRLGRLEESVRVIRGLMSDGPLSFAGRHYRISGLEGWPKPVQRAAPPILIGGARKRILSLAARVADIVGVHVVLDGRSAHVGPSMTAAATAERIDWIRAAAGERLAQLELQVQAFIVAIDRPVEEVERDAAKRFSIPADEIADSPHVLAGSVDTIAEKLLERRERLGISYVSTNEANMTSLARVVARLHRE